MLLTFLRCTVQSQDEDNPTHSAVLLRREATGCTEVGSGKWRPHGSRPVCPAGTSRRNQLPGPQCASGRPGELLVPFSRGARLPHVTERNQPLTAAAGASSSCRERAQELRNRLAEGQTRPSCSTRTAESRDPSRPLGCVVSVPCDSS